MKKFRFAVTICFFLAIVFVMPGLGQATVTSSGQASILWDSLAFTNAAGAPVLILTGPAARAPSVGVSVTLSSEADPYNAGWGDPGWISTSVTGTLPIVPSVDNVTGTATTDVSGDPLLSAFASALLDLSTFGTTGSVDRSQATFSGQFTVAFGFHAARDCAIPL